jgi:hypothetical protein
MKIANCQLKNSRHTGSFILQFAVCSLQFAIFLTEADAAFDIIGWGARSSAVGGAFNAGTDDPETVWYNPSAINRSARLQATATYVLLYPGLEEAPTLSSLGLLLRVRRGSVRYGFSVLHAEGWTEQAVVTGYGYPLTSRLAIGVDLKGLRWKAGDRSHTIWSLNTGVMYETGWFNPTTRLRAAVLVKDINSPNLSVRGAGGGKLSARGAVAIMLTVGDQTVSLDMEPGGSVAEVRFGYETPMKSLEGATLRLGGRMNAVTFDSGELDAGFGYAQHGLQIDYAYTYPLLISDIGGVHRVSVGYRHR